MGFTLDHVVPWGRSYDEYVAMFALTEADLNLRILGCGDGPAAFNSELTKHGGRIVSVDPMYAFETGQIRSRVSEAYKAVIAQMYKNRNEYVWNVISSVEELGQVRMSAMELFLADYDYGKSAGRYIAAELPSLPFASKTFDIALSSHFLFLYSAHLTVEFHVQSIEEMLRVAREVRIFPLLTLDGILSPHLNVVVESLINSGFSVEIKRVLYEFQRGGNDMLLISSPKPTCENIS